MISKFDLLYNLNPDDFDLSERRFNQRHIAAVLNINASPATDSHRVEDKAVKEVFERVDQLCITDFQAHTPSFTGKCFVEDLNLEEIVTHLLRPRFTPEFQMEVLHSTPKDLETALYRQEGIKELIEDPKLAKGLEDSLDLFQQTVCAVLNRAYMFNRLQHMYASRRTALKYLNRFNLEVLQKYTTAIQSFSNVLEKAKSRPMLNLKKYIAEVKGSGFFQNVFPVFDVEYFKDYRLVVDMGAGQDGVFRSSIYKASEPPTKIPGFKLLHQYEGMLYALLKMLCLPSTYAMDATNATVERNLEQIMKIAEIVGPVEFYTDGAAFYRRMKSKNMPVQLPEILSPEERTVELLRSRNPLLLYQKGTKEKDANDVVPNDISYTSEKNIFVITGSNNGGKTCYVKTVGVLVLFSQNGLPVTAECKPKVSIVDGIYTHFVSPDDIMAGEGRLLNELKRVGDILRSATPYSLVILDEPCGGTDAAEGTRESEIILRSLRKLGAATYFTTHLHGLCDLVDQGKLPEGRNMQVEIIIDKGTDRLIRTYKLLPGRATSSYGIEIAKQVGLTTQEIDGQIEERVVRGNLDPTKLRL